MQIFALLAALASGAVLWIHKYDVRLPYPGHHHIFMDLDPAILPTNPSPLEGVYAPNELLRKAHRLFDGVIQASEHVAISPSGNLTLIDKFGYVHEAEPADKVPGAVFPDEWALDLPCVAYVGPGRPLGFHHDPQGNLYIADALKGLLRLEAGSRRLEVVANRVSPDAKDQPGSPTTYVNALDIAADGTVYFSDSQTIPVGLSVEGKPFYDTFRSYLLGLFGGSITGRLLKYDPATRRTEVLVSGLWFTNGVALAADESWVAVVETSRLRVHRHWLKGPRKGTTEVLIDRLPGFPDGIARASDGNLWVALVAPVTKLPHVLKYKVLRVLMTYLPPWARPPIKSWGAVLKISPEGLPLQLLMDPDGSHVAYVSAVTEHDGRLYFGNVRQDYVSYMHLRDVPPVK